MVPFLIIDSAFLAANLLKLADGGYLPLVVGALIVLLMSTWVRAVSYTHLTLPTTPYV